MTPQLPKWQTTLPETPTIVVAYMEYYPSGCLTAERLFNLAKTLNKLERYHRRHGGKLVDSPCLRLVQGARNGRVTALVETGDMMLKLQLKGEEWIVLGDALKVTD